MVYCEELAQRIRDVIGGRDGLTERRMFGGIAWMLNGNMACGAMRDELLVRLAREETDAVLAEPHVKLMEMGGRSMRGFVTVAAEGVADDADLARWVDAGATYAASLPPK